MKVVDSNEVNPARDFISRLVAAYDARITALVEQGRFLIVQVCRVISGILHCRPGLNILAPSLEYGSEWSMARNCS